MNKEVRRKPAQLRGEALKNRIVESIKLIVSEDGEASGLNNAISSSKLAAVVPCSRTTLAKHETLIRETLADLGSRLRRRTGAATEEALRDKIALLEADKTQLEAKLNALRLHHADLYSRLLRESVRIADIFRDDAISASVENSACVLCGNTKMYQEGVGSTTVVPMVMKKSDNGK